MIDLSVTLVKKNSFLVTAKAEKNYAFTLKYLYLC